jgi:hypothetical protein
MPWRFAEDNAFLSRPPSNLKIFPIAGLNTGRCRIEPPGQDIDAFKRGLSHPSGVDFTRRLSAAVDADSRGGFNELILAPERPAGAHEAVPGGHCRGNRALKSSGASALTPRTLASSQSGRPDSMQDWPPWKPPTATSPADADDGIAAIDGAQIHPDSCARPGLRGGAMACNRGADPQPIRPASRPTPASSGAARQFVA